MLLKARVQKVGARLQASCHVSSLTILRRRGHRPSWVHEAGVAISSAMHSCEYAYSYP